MNIKEQVFLDERYRDRTILEFLVVGSVWYHGIIKSYDNDCILIEGRGRGDGKDILLYRQYIETISIYREDE